MTPRKAAKRAWSAQTAAEAITQLRQDRICYLPDGRTLLVAQLTAHEREALIDYMTAYAHEFLLGFVLDAAKRLDAGATDVELFDLEDATEQPQRWLETTPLMKRLRHNQAREDILQGHLS